jgi:hypothetical protein
MRSSVPDENGDTQIKVLAPIRMRSSYPIAGSLTVPHSDPFHHAPPPPELYGKTEIC